MNKTIKNLMDLGFRKNDALVYVALTELKTSTPKPIISKTGLHRGLVYTSLEHLVVKKLISKFESKGKQHFSTISPDILLKEFNDKQVIAENVVKEIKKSMVTDSREITIHQGNEEYLSLLTHLIEQMPKASVKYILGTGGEDFMTETMRPIWNRYHITAKKQKVFIKMIGYSDQKKSFQGEAEKEGIYTVKYLTSRIENPAGIHIYPEIDVVLNIIYSDQMKPVTVIKIKDKDLVKGYLNLFNELWKEAKL